MRLSQLVLLSTVLACGGESGAPTDAGAGDLDTADQAPTLDLGAAGDQGPDVGVPDSGPMLGRCGDMNLPELATEPVVPSVRFSRPVLVTQAPGDTSTLFIVEQYARIRVVELDDGTGAPAVRASFFLDLTGEVSTGNEEGLLGLAFHPDYASNGRFFVYYVSDAPRHDVVAEYQRSAGDPYVANATEVRRLIDLRDGRSNHNGGTLAFGPDGLLYVSIGDEGGADDPERNGADPTTLFGSILRLDVDLPGTPSSWAAATNPFTLPEGLPEVWAYGLRNPWRMSFDRLTGALYIGDVGQDAAEEVNVLPPASPGGVHFGWSAFEATFGVNDDQLPVPNHQEPDLFYRHAGASDIIVGGCAVVGGYVYRGTEIAGLEGAYLFGDSCASGVAAMRWTPAVGTRDVQCVPGLSGGFGLTSFGEDLAGNLYMTFANGTVSRVVAAQ